jgi:hypothetical protein
MWTNIWLGIKAGTQQKEFLLSTKNWLNDVRTILEMAVKRKISNILHQSAEVCETECGTAS